MQLRSLAVNQFKRFTAPTRLAEIGGGLNLVVGPNEMGKSTLLDALRTVLFERYSSKARHITALQNDRSRAGPVVEVVFAVDGGTYTLTKRFVKSPYARLECPDGTVLEADAAEARLRDLLGFAEAGRSGANPDTLGMWGVLWVQQGQSFGAPSLSESARVGLSAGLESEVGAVLGGRRAQRLPQLLEGRRGELVTRVRRDPKGEYRDAVNRARELQSELEERRQQRREMSQALERLAESEEQLARLDQAGSAAEQAQLDQARGKLRRAELQESQIEAARSELDLRQNRLDQALAAVAERAAERRELSAEEVQLTSARERLAEWQAADREFSALREGLHRQVRDAEEAAAAAEAEVGRRRAALDAALAAAELADLTARQDAAASAQARLDEALREIERLPATDAALRRVREADNSLARARAQLSVAATRITFDIPPDRAAGVTLGGDPISSRPQPVEAVEPTAIVIPERGRILIDPGVAERERLLESRRRAESELRAALADAGAASPADAELQNERRRGAEQRAQQARQELELHSPEGGAAALKERIAALEARAAELPPAPASEPPPSRGEAEAAHRAAEESARAARAVEREARAAAGERDEAALLQRQRLSELQGSIGSQEELLERRAAELQVKEGAAPDDALASAVAAAKRARIDQARALEALEAAELAGARPQLEARIARLSAVLGQREQNRSDLRIAIEGLRARIEVQEGAGLDEVIEGMQRELAHLQERNARFEREIEVLNLLIGVLRTAEVEAREQYLEPVLKRVRPYLQMLFPNAEIRMDEDFQITGMSRESGYDEHFEHLSMGTQEQIAVLVRLAFAEMLVEQGLPAAVILDDALVFSDDQRMSLMFDILSHAAQRLQIVVFTCRAQLFEGLGAAQLRLAAGDPDALRSA